MTQQLKNTPPKSALKTAKAASSSSPALPASAALAGLADCHDALSLGRWLAATREAKGLKLRTLSNELNIRLVYLEALEKGCFDEIQPRVYRLGFLRSYAHSLGVDPQAVCAVYQGFDHNPDTPLLIKEPAPCTPTPAAIDTPCLKDFLQAYPLDAKKFGLAALLLVVVSFFVIHHYATSPDTTPTPDFTPLDEVSAPPLPQATPFPEKAPLL